MKILYLLVLLPLFTYGEENKLPEYTDYQTISGSFVRDNAGLSDYWHSGLLAFNGASEMSSALVYLKKVFGIKCVVETGTFVGSTTTFFSLLFDEVYTIEIDSKIFNQSKQNLSAFPNVHCINGNSSNVFESLLPQIRDKFTLFYLDAHWESNWPLLDELKEISKTHRDNCIIVIDDVKVPQRSDIPFDAYDNHECSLNYVKPTLSNLFSEYRVHYLIPIKSSSRAKLVITPKLSG